MAEFTIVGGGLVGPALSLALALQGHSIRLIDSGPLEGRQEEKTGRAVNITLCTRGLQALQELGLRQAVLAEALRLRGRCIRLRSGALLNETYGPNGESLFAIRRSELRNLLVSAARAMRNITFMPCAHCVDIDVRSQSIRVVHGNEETLLPFKHLIAADGVNSSIRRSLTTAGVIAAESTVIKMAYREMTLNSSASSVLGLDRSSLHFWPRGEIVLIGFPNTDHSTTLSLHMPTAGRRNAYQAIRTEHDFRRLFQVEFPDVAPFLPPDLNSLMGRKLGRMTAIRCGSWRVNDQVLFVGDAAHGIIPYFGQGANAGFEDCIVFRDLLQSETNVSAAFQAFEEQRKPDMDVISDLCFEHLNVLCSGLASEDRPLRGRVEQEIWRQSSQRSVYHYISFTTASYREAVKASSGYSHLLDQAIARLKAGGTSTPDAISEIVATCLNESAAGKPTEIHPLQTASL